MNDAASDFINVPIGLSIGSTPSHLPVVRAAVEKFCELMGFGERTRSDIILAVDEALTNVIKHAYHGQRDKPIEITLRPVGPEGAAALQIEMRDWGDQVKPDRIRSRNLDDVRPGGLGVHIMESCMDKVQYVHATGGGTFLTMVKTL